MVLLCFVLDLRTIPTPLLEDLKQALLQLANFYAISSHRSDRIGLCYLLFDRVSSFRQLKIAYSPREYFGLRDFHHAVNSLPTDAFSPYTNETTHTSSDDLNFPAILRDEVLYSWGDKDVVRRKVIFLTSSLDGIGNIDSETRTALVEAADRCVSVEFVLLEQKSSHLGDMPANINNFIKHICDLENCCFRSYLPDSQILNGLVKQWVQELKDDVEESLQACFVFKTNLLDSVNSVFCKLSPASSQIIEDFDPCQTCRCHGMPVDGLVGSKSKWSLTCPITGQELGALDFIENSVRVGKHTVLFLPSSQSCRKPQQVSLPLQLNIIERTHLGSLSEGVIIGTSYFVTPSACHEIETSTDEIDKSELNAQLFRGICSALHSLDQGLVCSSNFNLDTMKESAFICYYILQPSENGPMLLKRLAGSEEVLPNSDFNHSGDITVSKEIENSVQASLLKMGLVDYNPVLHERGFHKKLNLLVKDCLHFGAIPPTRQLPTIEPILSTLNSQEVVLLSNSTSEEDKTTACITDEWEQLIVNETTNTLPSNSNHKPNKDKSVISSSTSINNSKQLDVNTSRILERLEVPRQMKTKAVTPVVKNITNVKTDLTTALTKEPLFPLQPSQGADLRFSSSQPMRPTFQRLKRKH